jgi:hypothetical protein
MKMQIILTFEIAVLLTTSDYSQYDCKKFKKGSITISQYPIFYVARDKSLQLGFSVGYLKFKVESTVYTELTMRFAGTAQQVQRKVSLILANGTIVELEFSKSRITNFGNSDTSQTMLLISLANASKLKQSKISSVHFTLYDGVTRILSKQMNQDVLKNNLKCVS